MSMLPPEVHEQLAQLLQGLQSADNNIRSFAEDKLNNDWVVTRPDVLLMGFVEHIQTAQDPSVRSFAAVLFRRIASRNRKVAGVEDSKEVFHSLPGPQKVAIRQKLLECLQNEGQKQVRHKVGDAVAEIARQYADAGEAWSELLQSLFVSSQSSDPGQREIAFRIFTATPGVIQKQHEETVLGAFSKGFKDEDVSVRIAAMEAFSSFFSCIPKKGQKHFYTLAPDVLNILPPLKEIGDADNLTKALTALIELAEEAPMMFKPLFHNLVVFSVSVIQDKDLGDTTRQNALELLATFADYAPGLCKKDPTYVSDMVTQCLSLMADVGADDDDASEWIASEDFDVEESDLNNAAGEQCMDRLANKLGGEILLPPTFTWLPRMLTSSSWRDRHAALMAISAISEGCRDMMVPELDRILGMVVPALQDPHPRVRWAGCNALGQMSTDFSGVMQDKYHREVLSNIIPVLEASEPRIQSHAAAALVNFCEEAEKATLEPYLDGLISHLFRLLSSNKRYVQEQALSTIATIADSAETAFGNYYDNLMPLLFQVLRSEDVKELRLLRAKAMECATLIALAVGKQRMGPDALNLVQILGAVQANVKDADDPQSQYLVHCWGRMCRVLGQDFVPYLSGVMPPLMELAAAKPDIQLIDEDNPENRARIEDGWEIVPVKGKSIGIKTSVLEDKHMAIELIIIYAQQLEAAFEPYVLQVMEEVSLRGIAFFLNDPVRVASAKSIPILLNALKKAQGDKSPQLAAIWVTTVAKILDVLLAEPAVDTLAELYQCFYESVEVMGKNCLTQQNMLGFIEAAKSSLEDYQQRVKKRQEEWQEIDEGEEESDDAIFAIEDDQTLLSDMNKAFHTVFKNQETSFVPAWAKLMPFYDAFVTSQDATQRQWALCIFDDVLEFCADQSWSYQDHIRQPLLDGIRDPIAANRQAACYGVGVVAHKGGEAWTHFILECLPLLFQVCQMPNAREDDHSFATENACAAISKILQKHAAKIPNVQEVVRHWLNTLPVVHDEEAAPFAYMFLANLIDQNNPAVLENASPCFLAVAQALEAETLQGATAQRVAGAAKRLVQNAGGDLQQALNALDGDTQATVRPYFQ